jgi:hypothetical protein
VLPAANLDFSYGFSLLTREELGMTDSPLMKALAPWVTAALQANIF